jgi:hypothetical protein
MPSLNPTFPLVRKRPRFGCFGCLVQCAVILALGGVLMVAITGLFYPWAFYLGGNFHILPSWQGWGRAHTAGGDYLLWLYFYPTPSRSRMYLDTSLKGEAYVCTPHGENIRLTLGGGMPRHLKLSTDGEPVRFYMYHRPWNATFVTDRRPRLELQGNWRNPHLVMTDKGSISRAFQPDGTVYRGNGANRPYATEPIPITLAAGSYSDYKNACSAAHRSP